MNAIEKNLDRAIERVGGDPQTVRLLLASVFGPVLLLFGAAVLIWFMWWLVYCIFRFVMWLPWPVFT